MENFNAYLQEVRKEFKRAEFTELTFRPYLKKFVEAVIPTLKLSDENRKIKGVGRPDYTCFRKNIKIGYIETKDLGLISSDAGLKKILNSEQIVKYSTSAIPNIIITDYARFVLYRNQEVRFDVTLFGLDELKSGHIIFSADKIRKFKQLMEAFLSYSLPTIKTGTELAFELSKRAKLLKELAEAQLNEDLENKKNNGPTSSIYDFYEAFRELIKDATSSDCVDAYAQTITYGLFLSKVGSHDGLNRDSAVAYIPSTMRIIKKIFMNITGDELPQNLSWIVDEIIDLLNYADINLIISSFVFEGKHYRDPFIHFYEDFLKEYDPEKRKHLGVYYTPSPIVSFITNAINNVLKKDFSKPTGFADNSVNVLDFATGTGTFLANTFVLALKEIRKSGLSGIEREKIKSHLLKHFFGFEILVSPYVIAHLKLGLLLKQEGYEIANDERIQVYLTNTVDPTETIESLKGFLKELSQETLMANTIKLKTPILVVMGNPPYSSSSSNRSEWILNKISDYKKDLDERKYNLDDDYIKFMRFAQWKIDQNQSGVLGIISNNSYLDQPTFKIMRKSLIKSFDKFYILNLHGDQRRDREVQEGKDVNVFDIQQGVSIIIFIKYPQKTKKLFFYYDLYGQRVDKFKFLEENNIESIKWKQIDPKEPENFLMYKDFSGSRKYNTFFPIQKIFKESSISVLTKKDEFIVKYEKSDLIKNLKTFLSDSLNKAEIKQTLGIEDIKVRDPIGGMKYEWEISKAREELRKTGIQEELIVRYNYRPFDYAYTYFSDIFLSRTRKNIMKHIFNKSNIGLLVGRAGQNVKSKKWDLIFVTDCIPDQNMFYRGGATFLPLYLYDDKIEGKKVPNFTDEFSSFLVHLYNSKNITPEEVLAYIYAVLHSENYREKYAEFLKINFPNIPFVKDYKEFKELVVLGEELINIHLMKTVQKRNIAKFETSGSDLVEFIKYKDEKLFINKNQFFDNICAEIWDFSIGGYQVLDKWLRSRKGGETVSQRNRKFCQNCIHYI